MRAARSARAAPGPRGTRRSGTDRRCPPPGAPASASPLPLPPAGSGQGDREAPSAGELRGASALNQTGVPGAATARDSGSLPHDPRGPIAPRAARGSEPVERDSQPRTACPSTAKPVPARHTAPTRHTAPALHTAPVPHTTPALHTAPAWHTACPQPHTACPSPAQPVPSPSLSCLAGGLPSNGGAASESKEEIVEDTQECVF